MINLLILINNVPCQNQSLVVLCNLQNSSYNKKLNKILKIMQIETLMPNINQIKIMQIESSC